MGSLFKARDFWTTAIGEEEFDKRSMVVCNIDNDPSNQDKIIVGSFSGLLRIYNPKQKGFKADDLLLEQSLELPILQIAVGAFVPNSQAMALAVLHPRKLVVYMVNRAGGGFSGEGGGADPLAKQFSVTKQYEHTLERTSYNFCHGPFGGVYGKDYICVQSMDGQLNFFEQEKFVFARFLHNFLVPGHLCYSRKIDSFITNTSTFEVECYKYQMLATSSGSEQKEEKKEDGSRSSTATGKRIQADWTVNVGEDVVDIVVAKFSRSTANTQTDILVLGERTLFALKEQGGIIRQQKRMDFFPSCITPYIWQAEGKIENIIVGTYSNSLHIYNDANLIWAAKTQAAPVSIAVANAAKVEGMIVLLTQDGHLSVNYLGTDPASQPVQILESKELDYEEMDEEHRRLQALIRQAVNAGKAEPKDQVVLKAEVPTTLDSTGSDGAFGSESEEPKSEHARSATIKLSISYTGEEDIENAVLTVSVPSPFMLDQQSLIVPTLSGSSSGSAQPPIVIPLTFYLPEGPNDSPLLPTSLTTTCLVAYTNPLGEPLTTKTTFLLPLSLAGTVIPPVKNPAFKCTLDSNRLPPQLQNLFEDVVAGKGELASAGNVLTFTYHHSNNADVTILVSKNAGRYRIQSSSFEALWLLTSELVRRLKLYFGEGGPGADQTSEENQEPFCISYSENLPFQEYFASIDNHFKARQTLTASQQTLSERAHQFRSIQKRLLVRFKDRNPSPLANLDTLFEDTYRQLILISEQVERDQRALAEAANQLTCATHLLLLLIRCRFQMKKEDFKVLQHYLSPIVVDSQTQGWEECTDAAMTHLLRTSLAKNAKESSSMPQPLQVPNDINKLKKHIALVCDRLAKGGQLRMEGGKKGGKA